jgi:ribosome-binding protein aMBF1 (putative translation factor)
MKKKHLQDNEKITFKPWSELHTTLMLNQKFKEKYNALEWKYQLINALIAERNKKGYSQTILAEKIGTKQSAIARFESGRYNPTVDFIQKLSSALGLTLTITIQ